MSVCVCVYVYVCACVCVCVCVCVLQCSCAEFQKKKSLVVQVQPVQVLCFYACAEMKRSFPVIRSSFAEIEGPKRALHL